MRHEATKSLYAYWCELMSAGDGHPPSWPDRSQVEPAAMRAWLGDVFILQQREGEARYRLAGTRLCALYGGELAGQPFVCAFDGADRSAARSWVSTFGAEATPLLFTSRAYVRRGHVDLETLVLPLTHAENANDRRALGITTPGTRPAWLGLAPIEREEITSVRVVRPWETSIARRDWPLMRPDEPASYDFAHGMERRNAPFGRRVAHLTVLEGGRM